MRFKYINLLSITAAAILLTVGMMSLAQAEEGDDSASASNAKWQAECSACHVAYPPRLLPSASWRAVMSGLDKHFGSDASLDPATAKEIGTFLYENAGRRQQTTSGKPVLRITETRWFRHEHDEIPSRVWHNAKVKSPANCAACHTQTERGNYSEGNIRMPK